MTTDNLKIDEISDYYNKGFMSGQQHNAPSEETIRKFDKLDMQIDKLKEGVDAIRVHLAKQDTVMEAILEQTKKTNGRVSCLEEYKPMLIDIKDERKEVRSKIVDYATRAVIFALVALIAGLAGGSAGKVLGLFR